MTLFSAVREEKSFLGQKKKCTVKPIRWSTLTTKASIRSEKPNVKRTQSISNGRSHHLEKYR